MHLVGFIISTYHDARSHERPIYHDARSHERPIYHDARSHERPIYHGARSHERQRRTRTMKNNYKKEVQMSNLSNSNQDDEDSRR